MAEKQTILEARDICKAFYNNVVLDHVNFSCETGEIHALVGENGAGKSTLMRIFSGVYDLDSGDILVRGEKKTFSNTIQAQKEGISIIHQEFNLVPYLSAAENIFLGRQLVDRFGNVDYSAMKKKTSELAQMFRMPLDPNMEVRFLTVAQQQMVEVMKAIILDTQILIMDEPTAALSTREVESLFSVMRQLRSEGRTIIYISHRINEVFEITDRITVLKDGGIVATFRTEETTREEVVNSMVGRQLENIYPPRDNSERGKVVMEVKDLVVSKGKRRASFAVHAGEILGITGLEGQGQREILRSLAGLHAYREGTILVEGEPVTITSPAGALKRGISFLTDDRKNEGLCLDLPVFRNIVLPVIRRLKQRGFITRSMEEKEAAGYIEQLNVKTESPSTEVKKLSGGNQQKVLLGKCLSPKPQILLIHEPTRGIDVAAKIEIYTLLRKLAREEKIAIVMVSSDLPEVLNVSDRILVIYDGGVNMEFRAEEATEENVMQYATNIAEVEK